MRATVRKVAPDAKEDIKYQIPTFVMGGNLVHFAAYKNHIGLYPTTSGMEAFKDQLARYESGKGSVQFPLGEPIPYDLIEQITRFRVGEVIAKAAEKKARKKST